MKRSQFLAVSAALALSFVISAGGGKDSPTTPPASNARTVKYEITGTYTGALTIVHTSESGATVAIETFALPWTRKITLPNSVAAIAFSGSTIPGRGGVPGQTEAIRIYSGGTVVKSEVATVLSSGLLALPVLSYVFPLASRDRGLDQGAGVCADGGNVNEPRVLLADALLSPVRRDAQTCHVRRAGIHSCSIA